MAARILIVEDDDFSRDLVKYVLEAAGHTVLEAADGGAGIRRAMEESPDLVVCDLQMPVRDGYEVVRHLRQAPLWRQVPVIAVSGFSMSSDREKALAAGFDEHITKPIDPGTFTRQVDVFLAQAQRATHPPARASGQEEP